jgi:hypothetical protein
MSDNEVLRRLSQHKRNEVPVAEEWRKLYNEELQKLSYCLLNIILGLCIKRNLVSHYCSFHIVTFPANFWRNFLSFDKAFCKNKS